MQKFELKEEHLKLLENLFIDTEADVPGANWKRPYGNSNIWRDVVEILEWEPEGEGDDPFDSEYSEDQEDMARRLHRQSSIALQICLIFREFKTGTFVKTEPFDDRSWRKYIDGQIITFDGDV